jgi:tetratricopeptide (TPR) repeat protein
MRSLAAASIALALGMAPAAAAPVDPNARYKELAAAYAAGNRAVAVAGIGTLDDDALRGGVESIRNQPPHLLLAALMLHTDRRLLERGGRVGTETPPACQSPHTDPAGRIAEYLLLDPAVGTAFVRRWFIAAALADQWDGCFKDALRWIDAGAEWFPADPEILLTRGTLYETIAALPSSLPRPPANPRPGFRVVMASETERSRQLNEARRSLERAVAASPELDIARVRLGRVLWRLGKGDDARRILEGVLARSQDDAVLHLAHLFLARVHQDADRHDAALRALRAAYDLQPTSQAAAIGLADALQREGEAEAARATVEKALAEAGRRTPPQSFWDYIFGNSRLSPVLMQSLREDVQP